MEKKKLDSLLGEAKLYETLESLIEKLGPEPETIAKAHYSLQASKAKLDQIKNEKEALEAKERKAYYKMKVKDTELLSKQQAVVESYDQIQKAEKELAKARKEFKEKKEEVEEMKDPLSIVKEEGEAVHADSMPLHKKGITIIKIGTSGEKEQLEPKVVAPDPEKDPEFDGPADQSAPEAAPAEVVFSESMNEIFRILKEEDEPQVGEVPAVEAHDSSESPVEMEPKEVEQPESAKVDVSSDPEVLVTDTSIRIEIPIAKGEKPVEEVSGEAGEAMVEALRVFYEILGGKTLNESEDGSVEIPAEAQAEVKVEGDKLVVEIPVEKPVEEVSKDESEAIAEAASVLASVLKEEGEAAAEPVHTAEEPKEHTPEVKQDEVHAGEQKAEEVKAPIVEAEEVAEEKEEEKKEDEAVEVKAEKEMEPVEEKPAVEPEASPEGSVVPSVEDTDTEPQPAEGEGTVEVKPASEADVMVSDNTIRIEVPLHSGEAELPEVGEEAGEKISESLSRILALLSPKSINEEETAEVSKKDAEAEISIEDGKLVIEIEAEKPHDEIPEDVAAELSESISTLIESLMDQMDSEKISKDLKSKNELQASEDLEKNEVDNSKREEGNKKAEEVAPVVVESAEPVHNPEEKPAEHTPEVKQDEVHAGEQKAEEVKAPIIESEAAKPEHSVDQQYDVQAAIEVDMNPAKHDKEHEIKVDSAEHKAEPTDVTVKDEIKPGEEAEYRSLKEAFLLEDGYFDRPSVSTVTPEQKQQKLVGQIGLLVARESNDPLYEEMLQAAAVARKLQTELQEKYSKVASQKAKQLIDMKKKKPEETQASALAIIEFLDAVGSGEELNEGIVDWVKGKITLALVKFLPERVIDGMIMKAHTKALSMVKTPEERELVANEFNRYLKDKRDKIEFIKQLISKAPEEDKRKADEKIKAIAGKVSQKVNRDVSDGVPVNASYEQIFMGVVNLLEADKDDRKESAKRFAGSVAGGAAAGIASTAAGNAMSASRPPLNAVRAATTAGLSATQAAGYSMAGRPGPTLSATQAAGYSMADRPVAGTIPTDGSFLTWLGGLLKSGVDAMAAFFATPLGSAIIGALVALALAGVAVLVAKLVGKIKKGLEDPYGEVFGN